MVELPMLVDPEGSTLIFEKNNMGGGCFGNIEDTNIEVRNIEDTNIEVGNIEDTNIEVGNIEDTNIEVGNIEDTNIEVRNIEDTNIEVGNIEDTNIEVRNIFFSIPLPFFKDRKDYFLQVFCADVLNGYLLIITVLVPSKTPNKTSPQD